MTNCETVTIAEPSGPRITGGYQYNVFDWPRSDEYVISNRSRLAITSMHKLLTLLAVLLLAVPVAHADVLIVADEFPAMQIVASKLKAEENIESKVVSQKEMPTDLSPFTAVVVYIHGALSETAENAFIAYTRAGGKLVLLHHSISSGKRKNAHWFGFLGISLPEGDVSSGGYKWIEGVTWDLVDLNPNHFIMTNQVRYPASIAYISTNTPSRQESLPGFTLEHSEVYLNHVHSEPRTLLMGLKFTDSKTGTTYMQDRAGWIKPAAKGTLIYLMPGHTSKDFENTAYSRIVLNAVVYKP
jgi:hypothetical protein